MRKILSLVIVLSMAMHCASRLGFLSYLYEKRHDLAYQVGLITEIPIALCSSDYDFNKGLAIHQEGSSHNIPGSIPDALEIILFAPAAFWSLSIQPPVHGQKLGYRFPLAFYPRPHFDIFHPPLG